MKLTPWFTGDQKPVRFGWKARLALNTRGVVFLRAIRHHTKHYCGAG